MVRAQIRSLFVLILMGIVMACVSQTPQITETSGVAIPVAYIAPASSNSVAAPDITAHPQQPEVGTAVCAEPEADMGTVCRNLSEQILASVVRIVLHGSFQKGQHSDFRGSSGHATVMDGRYLVTHNHFSVDMAALSPANNQGVTGFSLYNAQGQRIIRNGPIGTFRVIAQDAQTLVLDFGPDYFVNLGVASASFLAGHEVSIAAGDEVAQVDWDAERAYVVWTTITRIVLDEEIPYLEIDNFVMPGASGGGIFWNGQHIANNWADITVTASDSGRFLQAYSIAALNSSRVLIGRLT